MLNERVVNAAGRWPAFASAARAAGFALVSAFPMRRREQAIGAISVFSPRAGLEVGEADRVGVFARAVAIAISRQREIQRSVLAATQLQHALDSRVVVEQAKGAIAARLGLTPDAAFELMRRYARRASRPLSEVAGQAIRGELAVSDLVASRLESRSRPAQRMPARQSP